MAPSVADIAADYRAVRTGAGLMDRSDHGAVEVTGRDRASFLHAMLSNDVKAVGPGQGASAALLDVHGKVQVLLHAWGLEDRLLVVTPPGMSAATVEALDRYLFSEKAELRDAAGEHALIYVAGPAVPALVEQVTGAPLPDGAWANGAAHVAGAGVRVVRGVGEADETDAWLLSAAADGAAVREACIAAGARPVGAEAWEALRIEGGTPVYGRDVDATTLLPEIPLERWVSYSKGCYIGQEVVVRIRDRGHVNRHLCGLVLDGDTVPPAGAPIVAGGAGGRSEPPEGRSEPPGGRSEPPGIGRITSAAWSPGLKRPVALGYVRRQYAEPGAAVAVGVGDRSLAACVTVLPIPR